MILKYREIAMNSSFLFTMTIEISRPETSDCLLLLFCLATYLCVCASCICASLFAEVLVQPEEALRK